MSRKLLWISFGFVLLAVGGYFGYRWWHAPARSAWMLIPSDALLVLESSALQDTIPAQAQLNEMTLRTTPLFQEAVQSLEQLVWAPLDTANAVAFLHKKPVWYSLHAASRDRLGFIFYIPIPTAKDKALVNRLINPNADQFRVLSHPYKNERIYEMLTVRNESLGSFIRLDDFLIGSSSTILMESVVRRLHQSFVKTPLQRAGVSLSSPGSSAGLYVRNSALAAILSSAPDETTDWQTSYLKALLPNEFVTRLRPSPSKAHLIGVATDNVGTKTDLAELFASQVPHRIHCGELIPNQTATFFHFGLSDGPRFGEALTPFINGEESAPIREGRRKLRPLLQNEQNSFYRYLGDEVLLLRLSAPTTERRLVLLIQSPNVDRLMDRYQLAAILATGNEHLPNSKPFLHYRISPIEAPDLPAYLFGGLFRGFDRSWVTQTDKYLVIANSEGALQEYLQAVNQRTVWSESGRQRDLLEQTLRPANFTAYTRFSRMGKSVSANWPAAWQQLLNHSETALDNVEDLAYQSSYSRERIYSSLILGHAGRRASEAILNRVFLQKKLDLNAPLLNRPMVIGDFVGGSGSIWAIDNSRQFMLITPEGEKHPMGAIDGAVQSPLVPVDFYSNGRLQYAFTTNRSLYVADVLNGLVKLRSFTLPSGINPAVLVAPRPDQDRALALLLAHRDGSVYAYDKQQRRFTRTFPVSTAGAGVAPFQALVRNRQLTVVSLQDTGRLQVWQENGTPAKGFPVDLKTGFAGPAWLEGSNPATITTMGKDGELLKLSPDGLVQERTQLYRPVRRGTFRLLPEEAQNGYILVRTTDTELAVLDRRGSQVFEVRGLVPGQTTIRYHVLGSGIQLISVKSGEFTTLYDLNGHTVGDRPIPSQYPVELQFSPLRNKLYVYSSTEKALQIWSIKLR